MGTLYDNDIVLWSEAQADLLRRLAAGERVNDALDFENLIEEVESVGRSQFQAVASHCRVAMIHLLLVHAAPTAPWANRWLLEVQAALDNARGGFVPSMRQRIDLANEWRTARRFAARKLTTILGDEPALPEVCPFSLDELVAPDAEPEALLSRLRR